MVVTLGELKVVENQLILRQKPVAAWGGLEFPNG